MQSLLVQLLADTQGMYVKDINLVQAVESYTHRHQNFNSFDEFLNEFTKQTP